MLDLNIFEPPVAPSARIWSPHQTRIFSAVRESSDNLLIEAVAGGAKTSTGLAALAEVPRNKSVIALAFNRDIANELARKIPFGEARTAHSFGFEVLRRAYPGRSWDVSASAEEARISSAFGKGFAKDWAWFLARLISLAKASGIGTEEGPELSDTSLLYEILDHHDFWPEDLSDRDVADLLRKVPLILQRTIQDKSSPCLAFDDMLWLPLARRLPLPQKDFGLVDEAQDLNAIQRQWLSVFSRIMAVGDSHQAIYGFRGAGTNSMDLLRHDLAATELPLSVTYRCAERITSLAQTIVPQIRARPGAPEGEILPCSPTSIPDLARPDDLIICRNNGPLFALAMLYLKSRKPFRMANPKLEKELTRFISRAPGESIKEFLDYLEKWYIGETEKASARESETRLATLSDKYEIFTTLAAGQKNKQSLLATLKTIFTPGHGPILSTIHKSKGLEADRVFFLRPELVNVTRPARDWMRDQEKNLYYVAVTRAKHTLYLTEAMSHA